MSLQKTKTESYYKKVRRSKWSLALRRYIIDQNQNKDYAYYFGLDCKTFKKWIEIQFTEKESWDNYGKAWQFDHIVPVVYFDFDNIEELKLCWNFVNIRVEPFQLNKNRGNKIDVMAVKYYFQDLYSKTGFSICQKMIEKIENIILSNINSNDTLEGFINANKERLESIATFNQYEFNRFNEGVSVEDIILEREIFKKFGS